MHGKRYTISTVLLIFMLLTGCGGGGGSSFDSSEEKPMTRGLPMEIGHSYPMHKGDTIVKNAENTVVVIETDLETGETVAVLQSGSATIERE
jgi:hypothetical protein